MLLVTLVVKLAHLVYRTVSMGGSKYGPLFFFLLISLEPTVSPLSGANSSPMSGANLITFKCLSVNIPY